MSRRSVALAVVALGPATAAVVAHGSAMLPLGAVPAALAGEEQPAPVAARVGAAAAPTWPPPPTVEAAAAILETSHGQVLAESAADVPRPTASTIKLLTALTVRRHLDLDTVVTVPPEAARVAGATVGAVPGSRWTVRELVGAMLVASGNDAAVALAVAAAGSEPAFVELMRAEAAALGVDGELRSATGLGGDRMSARDLATVARAVLADPELAPLAGRAEISLPDGRRVRNRNTLLGTFAGADGLKTGYTEAAGWCLVASATRSGRTLVAVVLGAPSESARDRAAAALLEYGFGAFDATPAPARLALRTAGGWVDVRLPAGTHVLSPVGQRAVLLPPVETDGGSVAWWWGGRELLRVPVAADPPRPLAGPGAWLWSRGYAAVRAAAVAAAVRGDRDRSDGG